MNHRIYWKRYQAMIKKPYIMAAVVNHLVTITGEIELTLTEYWSNGKTRLITL